MTKPTSIVIFGASGDLTTRKLIPGLYNLYCKKRLPNTFIIMGLSRGAWTDEQFRSEMKKGTKKFSSSTFLEEKWQDFQSHLFYTEGLFDDAQAFERLNGRLATLEASPANRLYYLSVAPRFFLMIVEQLAQQVMLSEQEGWRRVVVEKPFGHDLASARALNHDLHQHLSEHQIYRIDHYLAKETVQNILVFRFANTIYEPLWNRNYIDHVQITAVESVDVGHRAGYYDQAGVLKDMFQNHLMQLTALVAMEPPASFDADAVRNEKAKVLKSIQPMMPDTIGTHSVRAQYEGYLDAEGVADQSSTPTYAALQLHIDNWRWQGVPFYLRSGKALKTKATEIIVQFKRPPHMMFPIDNDVSIRSNYLALCIQPHEGIHLRFEAKVPDTDADMRPVDMEFHYDDEFEGLAIPEAYERLLSEAIEGDATLFTRSDGIEAAWTYIDTVLQGWASAYAPPMDSYTKGSWGPSSSDLLLTKNGRFWRHGCAEH
ncbi:MAG: glucose-6-phosphate dehydrogenase [Chloroflexota bacterium]